VEIILIIIICIYLLLHFVYYSGIRKSAGLKPTIHENLPSVSVIVAAKNEESNIVSCIDSLKKINYPREKLEIILINDNSDDSTPFLMAESAGVSANFKILTTGEYNNSGLMGKTRALSLGIENSSGDIIMMTDADCRVKPDWVKSTVQYFDEGTGMVNGISVIEYGNRIFHKMQALDWIYLLALASSSTGIGSPLACIGNNQSYTRKAYESAGGYAGLDFSVTEDLALMRAVKKKSEYGIKLPVNQDCIVMTNPCATLSELASQKRRWFRGGTGINLLGYITGLCMYAVNIVLLTGFLYAPLKVYVLFVALKLISELLIILPVYNRAGFSKLMAYYPLFQLYFAVYGVLLPLSFVAGKSIKWKGVKY
jgi:cellulose synthase/poly-beta-1,6-N-acetylglucosamine synthase-like glycosyltransferase